jgi:hypothetical protein
MIGIFNTTPSQKMAQKPLTQLGWYPERPAAFSP